MTNVRDLLLMLYNGCSLRHIPPLGALLFTTPLTNASIKGSIIVDIDALVYPAICLDRLTAKVLALQLVLEERTVAVTRRAKHIATLNIMSLYIVGS